MIRDLQLSDFTLFPKADLKFGDLNILHGENSSGKTHILKLAYAITSALAPGPSELPPEQPTKKWLESVLGTKIGAVFRPDQNKLGRLARRVQGNKRAEISASHSRHGKIAFSFSTRSDRAVSVEKTPSGWIREAPIFLPTRELLSVYPGFVSLYETQAIPFDETWRDTCLFLGAPVARGPKKQEIAALLGPLEEAIGCKALLEGGRFYLQMHEPNAKVEADLVAEGFRKLSMVARLIANGSIDDKGYLFWDEPEANLNARLVRKVAPLLIELALGGVQLFIATHSLFLMRELEIQLASRKNGRRPKTRYIGLHPGADGVVVDQGDSIEESGDIAALDENLNQSDRYLEAEEA